MSQISPKLRDVENDGLMFWCPGCKTSHLIYHNAGNHPMQGKHLWGWNGDINRPTFTPSVLVKQGHYAYDTPREHCWCTWNRDHPDQQSPFKCILCHSFVTDGRIQFLADSTHELAGQTVDLPDWPINQ